MGLGVDVEKDSMNALGKFYTKVVSFNVVTRNLIYIFPFSVLLAIPIIIFATVKADARAGGVRLLGLFIWIQVSEFQPIYIVIYTNYDSGYVVVPLASQILRPTLAIGLHEAFWLRFQRNTQVPNGYSKPGDAPNLHALLYNRLGN